MTTETITAIAHSDKDKGFVIIGNRLPPNQTLMSYSDEWLGPTTKMAIVDSKTYEIIRELTQQEMEAEIKTEFEITNRVLHPEDYNTDSEDI